MRFRELPCMLLNSILYGIAILRSSVSPLQQPLRQVEAATPHDARLAWPPRSALTLNFLALSWMCSRKVHILHGM